MNQIPPKLIFLVVIAIALLAAFGVGSLCASMFLHTYADPAILTAIIAITSGLVGSLSTVLSSPRAAPSDSTTTQTITTTTAPEPVPQNGPAAVVIEQPKDKPIPVRESEEGR